MLKGFQVGEELTLIDKGIQRSEFSKQTWIDERQKGRASFLKLEKVGQKYLYGRYINFKEEGRELCYWQAKINPEDYTVYRGIRQDLKKAHFEFCARLDEHEKARKARRYELERKAHRLTDALMKIWEKENPRPKQKETALC